MQHADHVGLIRDAVTPGETWLELGSGTGAFTLALADLLGTRGTIHSIDQDRGALASQAAAVRATFGAVRVDQRAADFTRPLGFSGMDGVLMANSLHFVRDKAPVLESVHKMLRPGGTLIVVEYGTNSGNPWVPHPFTYERWEKMAAQAGFVKTRLLRTIPSRYTGSMYSAVSYVSSSANHGI